MMLRTSDMNLNQFGETMKEAVKQTMLQHEIIFKNQVHELHRLYWNQKTLMRELYQRELEEEECKSRMVNLAKEGNVGSSVGLAQNVVTGSDSGLRGFNLELPANAYIENSASNVISRSGYRAEEVINDKGSAKGNNLYCYEIIDLEGNVETGSNVKAHTVSSNGFKIPNAKCGNISSLQSNIACDMPLFSRVQKDVSGFMIDLNQVHDDCTESLQEHKIDHTGGSESSSVAGFVDASTTHSSHKQEEPINSSKPMLFDLNLSHNENSFFHPLGDHPINLTFSSQSSSSSVVQTDLAWKIPSNIANGHGTISNDYNGELSPNNIKGKALSLTGFTIPLIGETEDLSLSSERRQQSFVTAENINEIYEGGNHAKSEDTISTHVVTLSEDEKHRDNLLYITKPNNMSLDKNLDEESGTTQLDNTSVESLRETSHNIVCHHDQDHAISDAAKILAGICLAQPSYNYCATRKEDEDDNKGQPSLDYSLTEEEDEDDNKPEHSSDSFETMTLDLPEIKSHEQLVAMPKLQIEKDEEDEGSRSRVNRLRRGRGRAVRDFQKDVLPGMVSLSRHEICEDMHSIGYELRKNGSRRARGGGGGGGNWFVPVRSRRSKRNRNQ